MTKTKYTQYEHSRMCEGIGAAIRKHGRQWVDHVSFDDYPRVLAELDWAMRTLKARYEPVMIHHNARALDKLATLMDDNRAMVNRRHDKLTTEANGTPQTTPSRRHPTRDTILTMDEGFLPE